MKLEPLEQWICDRCRNVIESPDQGTVQCLVEKDESVPCLKKYGFRIIHNDDSSPSAPYGNCSAYGSPGMQIPLAELAGPGGLVYLCQFLDPDPDQEYRGPEVRDIREWLELLRRLQLPGYEEARQYWADAEADGLFEDTQWTRYLAANLHHVIVRYGSRGSEKRPSRVAPWTVPATDPPPECPECGATMVLRTASRGPRSGNQFWGCPGFPECRGLINVK